MWKSTVFCIVFTCLVVLAAATAGEQAQDQAELGSEKTAKVPPQTLPEGPGRDAVVQSCDGACHDASVLFQSYSADDWVSRVNEMIGLGAQVSDEDYVPVVMYLINNFSADTGNAP